MPDKPRIPRPAAKRLSLYLRELERLDEQDIETVSSKQLGDALGLTDAQVRKDLGFFGQFGHPGVGYQVPELVQQVRRIFGTDQRWNIAVIGAGNIGRALLPYGRFARKGFEMVAIFDADPKVVGTEVGGRTVRSMDELPTIVQQREVRIGIIAVPANAAQDVADALIDAGVLGILNFAPVRLDVHDKVSVVSVDFSVSLEQLAFQISLGLTGSLEQQTP